MVEIKRIIGILCHHLNQLFNTDIKPEHFRLAKHDKSDNNVSSKFWKLLNTMTENGAYLEPVKNTKQYFRSLGYSSDNFYSLPEDMSSGSRELLFAVCFILSRSLNNAINKLIEENITDHPEMSLNIFQRVTNKLKINELNNTKEYECYKKWLEGKINQTQNKIIEYETQNNKIFNIMKDNAELNIQSVTHFEILALNSPKYSKIFMDSSEKVASVLENHEKWLRVSHIFWHWMISVIEERRKSH